MDNKVEDADQPAQSLHSEHPSAPDDLFGEPVTKTKIGGEYQAQIPPLMTENERLQLTVFPSSHDGKIDVQEQLMFGQSIPVVWIQDQPDSNKETKQYRTKAHSHKSTKGEYGALGSGLLPVPGSSSECLSLDEHQSFLLALYLFGKNFYAVNKFMGDKGMRNVVSYYYGKFYKTAEHQKWIKYKKMKGKKKTILGENIFSDWRQEEIFSRIFPHVTDECKTSLTQASKMFEHGEVTFEAYVFTIRDMVGIDLLRDSIGIGKGKRDLTGRAKKPVKENILHPEYSSLTTEEIINLLNHDNELNKENLREIFRKAVWPRLLARGWHTEQTTNYALQSSKKKLVYLAPGITKFSRRGLHKGIQYFESFMDVLKKVASQAQLLEPQPIQERPETPPMKQDQIQFTIVDSGFFRIEDGLVRKSQLKSIFDTESDTEPIDMLDSFSSGASGETIQDSNSPAPTPDLDGGEPFVLHGMAVTKQPETLFPMDAGANSDQEAGLDGQRKGTRNRMLTTKALMEALAWELVNLKKKKREVEDMAPRHVRAKTAFATSSDSGHAENEVDGP